MWRGRSTGAGGEGVGGADGVLMEEELTAMGGWRSAVSMGVDGII